MSPSSKTLPSQSSPSKDEILDQIDTTYWCLLGRQPDDAEQERWRVYLSARGSYEQMLQSLVITSESRKRLKDNGAPGLRLARSAVLDTYRFCTEQMQGAVGLPLAHDTLQHALNIAPQGGLALEFGVYIGTTLRLIAAARQGREVYGFDSFKGLPEDWTAQFVAGSFAMNHIPQIEGADLVVGWFEDTLPQFLRDHPGPVDVLHIDSDLYSSAKTVLDQVGPRLRPGSVVVFDEYFNYPGWKDHEHKAWTEFVQRSGVRFRYEAFTLHGHQVALRLIEN